MSNGGYSEICALDPEHFKWLDLAEEFFKYEKGEKFSFGTKRNNPQRNGTVYDSIEEEWQQLNEIYDADPEHTVEPLMPIYREENGEQKMVGFYMERVDGKDMYDALKNCEDWRNALKMVESVEDVVEGLHEEGVVHGDLANNIILNSDGFKLYDPVGAPRTGKDYGNMEEWDEGDIGRLEDAAKMPYQDLIDEESVR